MAKKTFTDIASGFATMAALNSNFDDLESVLQNQVLYRNNPTGEPNTMQNHLDMNGYNLLNIGSGTTGLGSASLTQAVTWGTQFDGTGTHSLTTSYIYKNTEVSASSSVTACVSLSLESTGGWASGQWIGLIQKGSGKIKIVPDVGVTLRYSDTVRSRKQYSRIVLFYRGSDVWYMDGDVETTV